MFAFPLSIMHNNKLSLLTHGLEPQTAHATGHLGTRVILDKEFTPLESQSSCSQAEVEMYPTFLFALCSSSSTVTASNHMLL